MLFFFLQTINIVKNISPKFCFIKPYDRRSHRFTVFIISVNVYDIHNEALLLRKYDAYGMCLRESDPFKDLIELMKYILNHRKSRRPSFINQM